jgi:hypothetical protein
MKMDEFRSKLNKKGIIFTLDVTIAIIILIIGLVIIFYSFKSSSRTVYFTEQLSEDIIGVLSYTNIQDLCTNVGKATGCRCPNYLTLQIIACNKNLMSRDGSLLSVLSEVIERGLVDGDVVKGLIHEIFVTKNVIDDKRFGFAVLYLSRAASSALELYNTETYSTP